MNILALADVNPGIDLGKTVKEHNIDVIITLGDFTREDIIYLEHIKDIPKIGIYGNHCSGTYMPELGIWDMHLKTWDFMGYKFGGFEGCVRYKENPQAIMYTQEEANSLLKNFPPVDIFICHCPPRGINDEEEIAHQGFDALKNYLERSHPKLLMHGHTYPTPETEVKQSGLTTIEYVHGYKIITI